MPASAGKCREVPVGSGCASVGFPQTVLAGSFRCGKCREVPVGSGKCWEVLGSAEKCREVPYGTAFHLKPETYGPTGSAGKCREVPGSAGKCREVPGSAGKCGKCREVPGSAGKCREMRKTTIWGPRAGIIMLALCGSMHDWTCVMALVCIYFGTCVLLCRSMHDWACVF